MSLGNPVAGALALTLLLAGVPPAHAFLADFPSHSLSIGAQAGIAYLSMANVNDQLGLRDAATGSRFEDLHRGWEGAADLRYALTDRAFLGIEGGVLRGTARDRGSSSEVRARGIPLVVTGGLRVDRSNEVCVRVLAGLGALVSARFEEPGAGGVEGTAFLGYVGGEVEIRVLSALALTAQGLARSAILSHPDGAPYNVDFSGGSVRAGLRAYVSGGR